MGRQIVTRPAQTAFLSRLFLNTEHEFNFGAESEAIIVISPSLFSLIAGLLISKVRHISSHQSLDNVDI